ncbi:MAG: hypothetical protein KIS68_13040 [Bauldia sp.]|nr:hypothetical protein [Bauldia sp.]
MRFVMHPVTLAVIAAALAYVLLSVIYPTTCVDGWASPSIGIQGACSSHGGVARSLLVLRLLGALVAGLAVWLLVARFRRPAPAMATASPNRAAAPQSAIPPCPVCGTPLRLVTASGGGERYRWECPRDRSHQVPAVSER